MRDWFDGLEQRDQRALAAAAAVLFLLFFYLAIWQPLTSRHAELSDLIDRHTADLQWMRTVVLEVSGLQDRANGQEKDSRTLIARVTAELKSAGLEASRMRPEGDDRLRLTVEDIAFSRLLPPLMQLSSRYGVFVLEAAFEPESAPGMVTAQLLLQRSG